MGDDSFSVERALGQRFVAVGTPPPQSQNDDVGNEGGRLRHKGGHKKDGVMGLLDEQKKRQKGQHDISEDRGQM